MTSKQTKNEQVLYQIKNHCHFLIFFQRILLKITVSITLENVNRPNKKFFLFTNYVNLFFAIICHKNNCLFGKISPIFKNTYHKN